MVETSLVMQQIQDGEKIIKQLQDKHVDVTAACWLLESERDRWIMYIVSKLVDEKGRLEASKAFHATYFQMPELWIEPLDVKFIGMTDPIAKEILEIQQRGPVRLQTRYTLHKLGGLRSGDAHIYPLSTTP
jgi:hypothetical protein